MQKEPCIKSAPRYSMFYPTDFTKMDITKIEECPMESAETWSDLKKYAGKTVLFETTSAYFHSRYSLYLERKNLKVGMISKFSNDWGEPGYNMAILKEPGESVGNHALTTSFIKYSNFKIKLPSAEELDKIKAAILTEKAEFEYLFNNKQILEAIEAQKSEYNKSLITESQSKLEC